MSTDDLNMRNTVRAELDAALANGQFAPGGYLYEPNVIGADELALDLVCFSPALDGVSDVTVLPHVREWLTERTEDITRV